MAEPRQPSGGAAMAADQQFRVAAPQIALPKGGGAIRGIGEKFAANPVSGTGSLSVPIYTSPGRSGFGPQLTLSYDSGSGNGPFGFGWSLALPMITRKTDKGLPQYADAAESDTFILSGAEDLVPSLVYRNGAWERDVSPPIANLPRAVYGKQYRIHRYRPRVEGLFARIERWANVADRLDTFWRSITKDNVTTWYGRGPESRVADPADATRIFSWLICESYDDRGNVVTYSYLPENSAGVDVAQAAERNRSDQSRSANRYVKHISYANRTPYFPDLNAESPVALPTDWCFELVFDYGEHDLSAPVPDESKSGKLWYCRADPFSTYRPTFEVRTYRLCRRALMFHHFAGEKNVGADCLVRSTDFAHAQPDQLPLDPTKPFYSYLLSVAQTGYKRRNGGYLSKSLPPLEFGYTEAAIEETVREIDPRSLENLPCGLEGTNYRWVDLDGEGLSGILSEQAGGWSYKANSSPINQRAENGAQHTLPQFGPTEVIARQPSFAAVSGGGRQQLLDLSGDGHLDMVDFEGPTPGFFERTEDQDWKPFATFASLPSLDWQSPNLKFIDVTGDGHADLLISEDDAFWWHNSLAASGFGPGQRVSQAADEEKGPKLVFADGSESIFLADMSGDGLTDLVRLRNGEACYWPNLGYGRFGAKVAMDHAPWFEAPDLFDGRRIRLADIDGSGTSDIMYFASGGVHLYFNQSGNAWGDRRDLQQFPPVDSLSSAAGMDLLGKGTACLVWSSPLPGNARRPMRYVDLMGGQKPHLLVRVTNNLGAETRVQYAPSTKFYLADKLAGTPWLTRVPFPVHVVERVETYDYISRNRFVTRYAYHHGYYDGLEREFRGFGRVDQWDTEEFAALSDSGTFPQAVNIDAASNVPPVHTKTWFHTGVFVDAARISKHFAQEYYNEGNAIEAIEKLTPQQLEAMLLLDSALPTDILLQDESRVGYSLTAEEAREACRALRGSILRQEIYAEDDTDKADRPYSVSERNYTIEVLQPQGSNSFAVFFTHPRETVDFHYDRKLFKIFNSEVVSPSAPTPPGAKDAADPRVTHALTLVVDAHGNVLQSVTIGYGRRYADSVLSPGDRLKQATTRCTYTDSMYTDAVLEPDAYRAPLPAQVSTYELFQAHPGAAPTSGVTNLFRFAEWAGLLQAASDGSHDVPYETLNPTKLTAGQPYRRLIERVRTLYRPNDMAVAADPRALLPLGKLQSLALPGSDYKLAFTPGLISQVYQRAAVPLLPTPSDVLASTNSDGGGYVDLDGDGHWWIPSGRAFYAATVTAPQEKIEALAHFFLPRRFEDAFGKATTVEYDAPHDLLVAKTTDAVGNMASGANDYRTLQPALITDPNGNRVEVRFDALGLVAGTAVMGKTTESLGDSFTLFTEDLDQQQKIDPFFTANDPRVQASDLLGTASTRIVYDVDRFRKSRALAPNDPSKWEPAFAATLVRETHISDLADQPTKVQLSFSYLDGHGREIQKKIQAEPGRVTDAGPILDPRWVGSGWTTLNNKGKPVRQYEPFFSKLSFGHQFEFGLTVGVSPILCYDSLDRVVATLHPNHTYEKAVFDPWRQDSWDVCDTVTQGDPKADLDVGDFFQRLPVDDYSKTWYAQRIDGTLGPQEEAAAAQAATHEKTPTIAHFDTLGRTFLTIVDNAGNNKYATRVELDIEGNQRFVTDALDRKVMLYDYDMLGNRVHQASMEAGERWMLNDVAGKAIRAWDSRGHNFTTAYDDLRRPTDLSVHGTDANSDSRTLKAKILFEKIVYGENQPNPETHNLRTRVFQHCDGAGIVTNMGQDPDTKLDEAFDFKGNLRCSSRQLVQDPKALADWSASPALQKDAVFTSSTHYDALNRVIAATTPDQSVIRPIYNEANLLEEIYVSLHGAPATSLVTNIDYNAKGQRELVEYANNTSTSYEYDQTTFRLARLTTTRRKFPKDQRVVQDLSYTYDPAGNITHIQDDADIQNVIFFRNKRVEPSADYTYDAIYRLIEASGREYVGQMTPTSYNDASRVGLLLLTAGPHAMGTYTEQYQYDAVGNFKQFKHVGTGPQNSGWTRSYTYDDKSLLEPANASNRLTNCVVGTSQEVYGYDPHGSMIRMPQLQSMQWDFRDRLSMTQRRAVSVDDTDGVQHKGERTYYAYDAAGQRVRKTTERSNGTVKNERLYLGGLEIYFEYDNLNNVTLRRETLHVMDDKRRVALIETKTIDAGVPENTMPDITQRYQFANHLGTACLELDENAAVISYEEYFPHGSTAYQAGRSVAEVRLKCYRYTGKERDEETGFTYNTARYYAPWIGRWTSSDPAGMLNGPNSYLYVSNNPICRHDPLGTQDETVGLVESGRTAAQKEKIIPYSRRPILNVSDADRKLTSIDPRDPSIIEKFKAEFSGAAKQFGINPGLLAGHFTLELEPADKTKLLQGEVPNAWDLGLDDFVNEHEAIVKAVPGAKSIRMIVEEDPNEPESDQKPNSKQHRYKLTADFTSVKDAISATAAYLKYKEKIVKNKLNGSPETFADFPSEVRFQAIRLATNPSKVKWSKILATAAVTGRFDDLFDASATSLDDARKREDVKRAATIHTARAIDISQRFFGVDPLEADRVREFRRILSLP